MSSHCGKAFLYFYNLVYLGFSAVLIYLAVFFVKNWSSYTRIAIDTYAIVPAGIIVAVSIIFLVAAIIGIYGTGRSNRCCLGVFFAFLLAVFILEIVLGSLGYVYHQKIEANVKKDLTTALKKYPIQGEGIIRDAFNKMQSELKCCGVKGPNDWKNVTGKLPKSCCLHPSSECSYTFLTNVYQQGCYKTLSNFLKSNLNSILGVGIGFAIFQVIGMIGTCYLIFTFGKYGYLRMPEPRI